MLGKPVASQTAVSENSLSSLPNPPSRATMRALGIFRHGAIGPLSGRNGDRFPDSRTGKRSSFRPGGGATEGTSAMQQVRFRVVQGQPMGKVLLFPVGREFLFGRGAECAVRANSEWVSRQHCLLRVDEERAFLRDLGSR